MANWSTTTKHEPSSINNGRRYELRDRVSIEQLNNMTENSFYAMEASSVAKEKAEEALKFAQGSGTTVYENGSPVSEFNADKKANVTDFENYYTKEQVDDLVSTGGSTDVDLSNYYTKDETYSKEEVDDKLANLEVDIDFSDYYTKTETDGFISTINQSIANLDNNKANKSEVPKLYDETGQNTDGAMTQKAVTDELNRLGIMYKGVCETDFINDDAMHGSVVIDNFPYQAISECPIGTKFEISFTHPSSETTWALILTINDITGIKVGITSRDSVDYSFDTYELSWIANDTIDFEWNGTYLIAKSVSGRIINPDVVTSEFSDTVRTQSTKGSIFFPLLSYGSPQNTSNIDDSRTTPYETEILHKGITGETVFNSYNDLPLKINHKSRALGIGTGTLEDGTTTTGLLLYDDVSTKLSDEHKTLLLPRKNGVLATLDDISSGGTKIIWEVWE